MRNEVGSMDEVVDYLLELTEQGAGLCPAGADRTQWSWDVLAELAHAVELLEGVVERVSGRHNPVVARNAHILATTINAHRNVALARVPAPAVGTKGWTRRAG
ncbi:hypothetical protein [Actinomycetospora soli]|uniref:hypothetical protein n=1 Tax=Actinomycetospora soli TaxID=2893887 RepID=UPI001E3C33C7|nr:hypothetical protein [Actinomycetospora soli]MCD2186066.1 hypothetical protein [Actinomycetospora soli]